MATRLATRASNIRTLFIYLAGYRLFCAAILFACAYITPFDASHVVSGLPAPSDTITNRFISTTLRWDVFHFLEIAQSGYTYEHLYAFLPGVPAILRATSAVFGYGTISGMLWRCWVAIIYCLTLPTLYDLTLFQTGSQELAMLASACSIIVTSPSTLLHAPYTEPFFAFCSFKGMLYCSQRRWISASLMFALACCFRSNGVLLVGYLAWGLMLEPLSHKGYVSPGVVFKTICLSIMVVAPVILHQIAGYLQFCTDSNAPDWCSARLPLIYSYVQSKYWDVGLFRYWTIAQLPNFILAAPPLALLLWASSTHMKQHGFDKLSNIVHAIRSRRDKDDPNESLLVADQITPHAIHAFVLCLILIFASHTQIALRLSSSLPFTYWAAARLWIEKPQFAKLWTGWSIIWSTISLVTWGLFLPPA